ncbi:diacylglycerol/lipid kinase family protein [Anaerocolumna sp. MB42-C2]|uniref:diacylglycerol/lipid kinase family protein n=1 Tax=Anaerocolumna sp. MB42-C2 TaxID=3070997 RepID=UPI0027E1E0C6|nr:YegS/Rv2252/BmrU family lipid kinase [Anaerocolumna sp. MB42-C2]WMJ86185.1 YegS/Rv2252/BmrU family lipid kinase [Anaerocolumna sp. MB42-C2]
MKKKLLFIYNPLAGKSKIKNWLSSIIESFVKGDYEVVIYATTGRKDAKNIVMDCLSRETYDLVVCSGGDGTLNEVISGIMHSEQNTCIGYIPSGTTNDFAYNLKLPKNLLGAAKVVLSGEAFPCDVGIINGEYFTYTAAFGLFTDASYETPQTTKNMLGRLAYILEGVKRLPNWKSYQMEITCGDKVMNDNFIYGMVANSISVGGIKGLTGKDVQLDDGQFEGIFIKMPQNVMDFQSIINDLLKGNLNSDHIFSFPVKEILLTSEEMVPWSIDGEFGGEFQTVNISNLKQAVKIIRNKEEIV